MVKILTVICAALAFCTCASSGGVDTGQSLSLSADSFWLTLPGPGALVIIGASGRQLKQETEIELAREDAARKAAMYHGLEASFVSVQNIGANIFDYYTGTELELEYDRELEKYMDRLVYDGNRDVMKSDRGVFIRFAYPAFFPGNISYEFGRNRDGSPEWTSRPPEEISGFMAGIGFSGRQFYLKDTFEKSCDAAVAALVSRLSTNVTTRDTSDGYQNTSLISQRSAGYLNNFLVLEIWADPNTQAVWTLAIARKAE